MQTTAPGSSSLYTVLGCSLLQGRGLRVCLGSLLLLAKDTQGFRMDLRLLCPHPRAQKSGGLGEGRGNVGKWATGAKRLPQISEER